MGLLYQLKHVWGKRMITDLLTWGGVDCNSTKTGVWQLLWGTTEDLWLASSEEQAGTTFEIYKYLLKMGVHFEVPPFPFSLPTPPTHKYEV